MKLKGDTMKNQSKNQNKKSNAGQQNYRPARRPNRTQVVIQPPPPKRRKKSGGGHNDMKSVLMDVLFATAGAVGGAMIASKLPIANSKLKALAPIAGGYFLAKSQKSPTMKMVSMGLMLSGALSLTKQFFPNAMTLAGDEFQGDSELMGYTDAQLMQIAGEIEGELEYSGAEEFQGETTSFKFA